MALYDFALKCPNCQASDKRVMQSRRNVHKVPYDAYFAAVRSDVYGEGSGFEKKLDFLKKYVAGFETLQEKGDRNGIYLFSTEKGCGKTFLASVICNEIFARYLYPAICCSEARLLDYLGTAYNRNTEQSPKDNLKNIRMLFIDDIGQKKTGREYLDDVLFDILDYRMQKHLPTIFTSNFGIKQLAHAGIESRIIDRIYSIAAPVEIPAFNVRRSQAKDSMTDMMEALGFNPEA
jgi:primosomal protein DnaI